MSTIQDPLEQRAVDAGRAARMATTGTHLDLPAVTGHASGGRRRLVLVAAGLVVVLLVGLALVRATAHRDHGLPAFEPRPVPGSTPFHSRLASGVRIDVPASRFVQRDTPTFLFLGFHDVAVGGLLAIRVSSYPAHDGPDLARDVSLDSRVHVVSRNRATVGGEAATRLVVRPVRGITESDWFCPVGGLPCMTINATGGNTLYVFRHRGQRYVLVGGSLGDAGTARMRSRVDGAAATWRW